MKWFLLLPAMVFLPEAPLAAESQDRGAVNSQFSDQEIAEIARKAMENPQATEAELRQALQAIQNHVFRDNSSPEREYATYARGAL